MPGQEFNVEVHGTLSKGIAGSECHRAPLVPDIVFACPGCEQEFFICSRCNRPARVVEIGTQEVKF